MRTGHRTPLPLLLAALLMTSALLHAEPSDEERFDGESLLLEALERKGVTIRPPTAPSTAAERAAYQEALGKSYVARLGSGDGVTQVQSFFARRGRCARVAPTIRAELRASADFMDRPLTAIYRQPLEVIEHFDVLRAAYCVLPLIVRRTAAGLYEVAMPPDWLLLRVAPDLEDAARRSFGAGDRPLLRFLRTDAVLDWVESTVWANALREARAFFDRILDGVSGQDALRGELTSTLDKLATVSPREVFTESWLKITSRQGGERLPAAIALLALMARGRGFLDVFLPRYFRGELPIRGFKATGDVNGYYDIGLRALFIGFTRSPAKATTNLLHEGTHALDDLTNGFGEYLKKMRNGVQQALERQGRLAREAAEAGDEMALEHFATCMATLIGQYEHLEFVETAECEYLAWRAQAAIESEIAYLAFTRDMLKAAHLVDRKSFETTVAHEDGYAVGSDVAEACLRAKDWDADEFIERPPGWKQYPDPSRKAPLVSARDWRRLGDAYRSLDLPEQAMQAYGRALELDRTLALAHQGRALLYASRGDWAQAALSHSRAIERSPRLEKAYLGRGRAYRALGSHGRALRDFTRAIEVARFTASELWAERGLTYIELGRWKDALDDLEMAIGGNRQDTLWLRWRARAYRGAGNREKASADLDEAVRLGRQRRYVEPLVDRAEMRFEDGDLEGALGDLNSAIEIMARSIRAREIRARVFDAMGRTAEAAADRSEAARLRRSEED